MVTAPPIKYTSSRHEGDVFAHFAPLFILQGFASLAVKIFTAKCAEIYVKDGILKIVILLTAFSKNCRTPYNRTFPNFPKNW